MALYLSTEGHLDLQHFFLKWAPDVPPYDVRCRLLGLTDFIDDSDDSFSGDDEVSIESIEDTDSWGCCSDTSLLAPTPIFTPNVSSSAASSSKSLWASPLGIFSNRSDWRWSLKNLPFTAAESQSIADRKKERETQTSLDKATRSEDDTPQSKKPFGELERGLTVTTVDSALRCIQEIKSFSDVQPAIDMVAKWAEKASSSQLKEFNDACEIYPYTMWIRPYFPQLEYSELVTVLPYIKQGYNVDARKNAPYINLEAAHLLGMVWSMLYLRNIITVETYTDGIVKLWENQDYARCDILDTILTTLIDGYFPGKVDFVDVQNIIEYRDDVRAAKAYHLAQIT